MNEQSAQLDLRSESEEFEAIAQRLYSTLIFVERLKRELRHSWLSNGRQESVAEHTWLMAFLALVAAPHLREKVNLTKVLKMVLVHDIVEAETGDIPYTSNSEQRKVKPLLEFRAIKKIRDMLGGQPGRDIENLWLEYERARSIEAKFAKALDNLEVQVQHNLAPIETWEEIEYHLLFNKMDKHCDHDPFLQTLCEIVKSKGEEKLRAAGVDVEKYKTEPPSKAL